MIKVQVINKGHQQLPAYATPQSAGMDLRANLDAPVVLRPLERKLIKTGLFIALPEGYEAQVRPRSGLALKHGIEAWHHRSEHTRYHRCGLPWRDRCGADKSFPGGFRGGRR